MDVCLRDESNSTIGRVKRRDDIPCVSVHLHHEAVGRGEVRHRLEVSDPVVKLLGDGVGNDGAEQSEGQHDEGDEADEEPPDQVVRAEKVEQVGLAGDPGTDYTDVVVTIVI